MGLKVNKIYSSADNREGETFDHRKGNTDIVVLLNNGKKYIASFFTYENIEKIRRQNQQSGDFMNGTYFCNKNMVKVEECSLKTIELLVQHLIDEGEFIEVFKQL